MKNKKWHSEQLKEQIDEGANPLEMSIEKWKLIRDKKMGAEGNMDCDTCPLCIAHILEGDEEIADLKKTYHRWNMKLCKVNCPLGKYVGRCGVDNHWKDAKDAILEGSKPRKYAAQWMINDLEKAKMIRDETKGSLNKLRDQCHKIAEEHGFWGYNDNITKVIYKPERMKRAMQERYNSKLMLITTELSEACEALRKDDMENFEEELADVLIRTLDLCGEINIDIQKRVEEKMRKNKERDYKHGKGF